MKQLLFIVIFLFTNSIILFSQILPGEINNQLTPKHQFIPGTRLGIILPEGFRMASNFTGITRDDYTGIQIIDLVGGSLEYNARNYTKENFEKKNIRVLDWKELTINNYQAQIAVLQARADTTLKIIGVVFGDTTFCVMMNIIYFSEDKTVESTLLKALSSIVYDKEKVINPLEDAPFLIDESKSSLKFVQAMGGVYHYATGGKESLEKEDCFLVIGVLPYDPSSSLESVAQTSLTKLEEKGASDTEVKKTSSEKINGYEAYSTECYITLNSKRVLHHITIMAYQDKMLLLQGVTESNFEKNIQELENLYHTIRFK